MPEERLELDKGKGPLVCRSYLDLRGDTLLVCLEPACGTEAPLVAGLEPWEAEHGVGSAQVIAHLFRETKKLFRQDRAHSVHTSILVICLTATSPKVPSCRLRWLAAALQRLSKHVQLPP